MEELKTILTAVGMLLLMIAIFAGAYWAPRLIAKSYKGLSPLPDKLRVVSKIALGKDQSLIVVKAADRLLLLGATPREISLITELDPADFPVISPEAPKLTGTSFSDVLKNVLKNAKSDGKE
ncbi:MAG TPA: flagellar biosynthetic protein FliO [Clostridiales bacterium]|nr:flagellar biosynthetic protein FliO [Clostridiales bacterium]